jgi:D-3-phosphoglycerate dehydrogenase
MPIERLSPAASEPSGAARTLSGQRIVLCYPVEPQHVAQIAAAASGAEIVDAGQERVAAELPAADIFCGHPKVPVPWDEVVQRGRLKWIQSSAAGLDHCLVPSVVASDIVVTSASGVLANQVADHTVALLTGLLRSLPTFFSAQQKREFIRRPTRDLHGARIGIIGLGRNGRRLAEVLSAFRTTIVATDWFPVNKPLHVAELLPADAVDEMLPQIDILILAAPLTNVTRGMIDARRLALLPRGALVINVARGQLMVTADLVAALEAGHLAGAGLDVTDPEPLPPESRLWQMPNVIITPHVGGQAATRIDDMTNFFCENLALYVAGQRLRNLVDKQLGFPLPDEMPASVSHDRNVLRGDR